MRNKKLLKARRLMKIYRNCVENPEKYLDMDCKSCNADFFINFWKHEFNLAAIEFNKLKYWFMPAVKLYEADES
jgi:hypothetical protein